MSKVQKISKEDMIEEIKEELLIYFKEGIINIKSFFNIDNIKFNDIYSILKIHFILSKQVRDYCINLENQLKNIKNATKLEKVLFKGKVRGKIDWNKTLEIRHNNTSRNYNFFVCDNIDKFFNTKENLVLKKVLEIIYNILFIEIGMDRFTNYSWFKDGEKISRIVKRVFLENVYLKKIDTSKFRETDKILYDVSKSRHKIYRDSAKILILYRKIMNLDKNEICKLFSNTFIELEDESTIFELYCIFKYLRFNYFNKNIKFIKISGKSNMLARGEDDKYFYEIYHDSIGRKDFKFKVDIKEVANEKNEYLKRKLKIFEKKKEIYESLEKRYMLEPLWGGKPDLLIFKIPKDNNLHIKVVIGEIKYTNNISYMYRGLEELLEYVLYIKDIDDNYIDSNHVEGLLFVDNIDINRYRFNNIKIYNRYNLKEERA